MSTPITIISVVRDFGMYAKRIQNNAYMNKHTLCPLDNSSENKGIPFRYNTFLESYDFERPSWLVFCHEDFGFTQEIDALLEPLDRNALYGPIGVRTDVRWRLIYTWRLIGQISESHKDGSHTRSVGLPCPTGTPVETFDGQCMIVHSDVIKRTGLGFDENLTFDLYVEDFCMNAKENFGIPSRILAVKCEHWSFGLVPDRYFPQEAYISKKYPHCCYTGTSSYSIGNPCAIRKLNGKIKNLIHKVVRG